MTLDEALMQMDKKRDYLVYRDAETDRVSVLVRRRDGHFDLVEANSQRCREQAAQDFFRHGASPSQLPASRTWS